LGMEGTAAKTKNPTTLLQWGFRGTRPEELGNSMAMPQ
jgi:hypothetical protein